jgi:hypothetical protein
VDEYVSRVYFAAATAAVLEGGTVSEGSARVMVIFWVSNVKEAVGREGNPRIQK